MLGASQMMKRFAFLLLMAGTAVAQITDFEKCQQRACYGYGPPSGTSQNGFIFQDLSVTPATLYCGQNNGWQLCASSAGINPIAATPQYRLLQQPDPGTLSKGGQTNISTDATGSNITIPGTTNSAQVLGSSTDYINAAQQSGVDYPAHLPYVFTNTMTRRHTYNDFFGGVSPFVNLQHGGCNFLPDDGGFPATGVHGCFMNANLLGSQLFSNTDMQLGGASDIQVRHYGHGDGVGQTMNLLGTGGSRGADEHMEAFRVFAGFHVDDWGIIIGTISTDANGQAVMQSTLSGGIPVPSTGHNLGAAYENGPLLNINPAKAYSAGDVASIAKCSSGLFPNGDFYMCATGTSATNWSAHYGTAQTTTLTAPISDSGVTDPFANPPVCLDASVASTVPFSPGTLFTIGSKEDNFEMPTVVSVGSGTIHACFAKPHMQGETITVGGGVGHAITMAADIFAPGTQSTIASGVNQATRYMAYPIVGCFAGNVCAVWVNPAGANQNVEFKSRSFTANTPVQQAVLTGVLTGTSLTGFTVVTPGNYLTANFASNNIGSIYLPPPTVSFAGSTCSVLPTAHTIYDSSGQMHPIGVVDTPGNCSAVTVTLQSTYANPYIIQPMLWARSNRNPSFTPTCVRIDCMNASTAGYMVAGGNSTDFAPGDEVITGMWWQEFTGSQMTHFKFVNKSGSAGPAFRMDFSGFNADALLAIRNTYPAYNYYGNSAGHWSPDANGGARLTATTGLLIDGVMGDGIVMSQPPRYDFKTGGDVASAVRVLCRRNAIDPDANIPCLNGNWRTYNFFSGAGNNNDVAEVQYDPDNGNLSYSNRQGGEFKSVIVHGTSTLHGGSVLTDTNYSFSSGASITAPGTGTQDFHFNAGTCCGNVFFPADTFQSDGSIEMRSGFAGHITLPNGASLGSFGADQVYISGATTTHAELLFGTSGNIPQLNRSGDDIVFANIGATTPGLASARFKVQSNTNNTGTLMYAGTSNLTFYLPAALPATQSTVTLDNTGQLATIPGSPVTGTNYFWIQTVGCSVGGTVGDQCAGQVQLPGAMPDASYHLLCQTVATAGGSYSFTRTTNVLPTASGANIDFFVTTTLSPGGAQTIQADCYAHHN